MKSLILWTETYNWNIVHIDSYSSIGRYIRDVGDDMQEQFDTVQPGACDSDEECGAVYSCSESDGVCKMVWWMILIIVILILIAVFSILAFLCRCLTCGLCCGNWMNIFSHFRQKW